MKSDVQIAPESERWPIFTKTVVVLMGDTTSVKYAATTCQNSGGRIIPKNLGNWESEGTEVGELTVLNI